MDLAPKHALLGEFRVLSVLGQGGSGVVYDAQWGPRRVALKIVHPSVVGTERIRTQFFEEARCLQTITHPSVVKVLAVGELPDGRPYLAMERLRGRDAREHAGARADRAPGSDRDVRRAVWRGRRAPDQHLVHRDLKPENVFIVAGKHAVLLDLGIAKELAAPASTTTLDGGVRGTPAYMAPERFFGHPAGVTTDLYELAVTLYAMLAGRLPWDEIADPEARLSPRPLVELVAIPDELDVEIRRAMSTRAQNRPTSAAALLSAVRIAAGGAAIEPTRPADTARMAPAPTTDHGKPWFADRQVTTDRGKTPLAWAPTVAAPVKAKRRRAAWITVAAMLAIAGAVIVWQLARRDDRMAPKLVAQAIDAGTDAPAVEVDALVDPDDPWNVVPEVGRAVPGALPTDGDALPAATARAEIAAAIRHVPADTHLIFMASVGELRQHEQIDDVLGKISNQPLIKAFLATTPPCIQTLVTGAEWAVFASRGFDANTSGTLLIRGRWKRADVETCFAPDALPLAMPDGKQMMQLKRVGWVDFVDDHTIYISVREDLAAAQVHELAQRGTGPSPSAARLLASLPAARSIGIVIDGSAKFEWPKDTLPKQSDLIGWLRADEPTEFQVIADTHAAKTAAAVVKKVRPVFDEVFKESQSSLLGSVTTTQDTTRMINKGRMTALLIAMISSQVP
ncbi:MAG: serine/threonine-protein kinase [Kofleriaceae bacterium]